MQGEIIRCGGLRKLSLTGAFTFQTIIKTETISLHSIQRVGLNEDAPCFLRHTK